MSRPDLTYRNDGLFTRFLPETPQGEDAWRLIAEQTDGTGAVLATQGPGVIAQLRAAGYTVHKARPVSGSIDDLLSALEV